VDKIVASLREMNYPDKKILCIIKKIRVIFRESSCASVVKKI
jgi:hypothetical protein